MLGVSLSCRTDPSESSRVRGLAIPPATPSLHIPALPTPRSPDRVRSTASASVWTRNSVDADAVTVAMTDDGRTVRDGGAGSVFQDRSSKLTSADDIEWQSRRSTLRIAFVDDETSNVRLGLRMLGRLGVNVTDNVTVLTDGEESLHPAAAVVAVTVARC